MTEAQTDHFNILSLDGGGSLGVYTLGVLKKVEELLEEPLYKKFQLIYGTSTGSIIGSLLARGESVSEISKKYFQYIPDIMSQRNGSTRSQALKKCANEVFQDYEFNDENFKTLIGVVATNYEDSKPMIFKSSRSLFQEGKGEPGFGCKIADVVVASCSASPFFDIHKLISGKNLGMQVIDGGFVANNPTLFAITDAIKALKKPETQIRVLSLGVGSYFRSDTSPFETLLRKLKLSSSALDLFETTISANNNTIDNLRKIFFRNVCVVRINDPYPYKNMNNQKISTNLLERNKEKLMKIEAFGGKSYEEHKSDIIKIFEN